MTLFVQIMIEIYDNITDNPLLFQLQLHLHGRQLKICSNCTKSGIKWNIIKCRLSTTPNPQ